MADDNAQNGGNDNGAEGAGFKTITSQADLDRIIGERIARERGKFADYDELKRKANEFDKAAEASKTELQKALDRAEAAEKRAAAFEAKEQAASWAAEIVKGSDVPASLLRGDTKEALQAHFDQLKNDPHFAPPKRRAVPTGKADREDVGEKGRAAAALRELRGGSL